MTYNIFDSKAPAMPKPSKGTEFCKLLLSQASKDMFALSFRCFSAHLTHLTAMQNFSICRE